MSDEKEPALSFPGIKLDDISLEKRRIADVMLDQLNQADAYIKKGGKLDAFQQVAYRRVKREYERADKEALNV